MERKTFTNKRNGMEQLRRSRHENKMKRQVATGWLTIADAEARGD